MKKILPIAGAALILALALTGCSAGSSTPAKVTHKSDKATTAPATPKSEKTPDVKPEKNADGTVVTFTGQGEKGADGEYAKFPVKIAASVTSIEKLSDTEMQSILSVAKDDAKNTLSAFDLYKINVHEVYVSGDDPKFQASYTDYNVVDAKGVKVNDLPLIGFDWCKSNSFTKDFITGTPNDSCLIGAVAKGAAAPAGVEFSQYGTPSEKAPIVIFK